MSKSLDKFLEAVKLNGDKKNKADDKTVVLAAKAVSESAENLSQSQMTELLSEIKALKMLIMMSQLAELTAAFADGSGDDPVFGKTPMSHRIASLRGRRPDLDKAPESSKVTVGDLDGLEKVATIRHDPKTHKREYLLHRPTEGFEYEKSATTVNNIPTSEAPKLNLESQNDGRTIEDPRTTHFTTEKNTDWVLDLVTAEKMRVGASPIVAVWVPEDNVAGIVGQENDGTWGELGKNPHAREMKITVKPGKYEIYSELKA